MKPQRFYGLHFCTGIAEYKEPDREPYRVLINEEAAKQMDTTFDGRPVFVHHVDEVDYSDPNLRIEADGFVVKSFYNMVDGKHWAEFLVTTENGLSAIVNKKWKLSNAYVVKEFKGSGQWHGMDYDREIASGEYEHLAIVPNPRYAESIILTPEEFKTYNEEKEIELKKLKNSKEENTMSKFNFFKKSKVENSTDLESMSVTLPKSKKEISIEKLITNADEIEMKKDEPQMANGDHHVMVGEHKMTVNELVEKHIAACNELEEMKKHAEGKHENMEDDEEAKKKAEELAAHEAKEIAEKKKNEEAVKEEEKKKNAKHFNDLKNADKNAKLPEVKIDLAMDKLERGRRNYGSN